MSSLNGSLWGLYSCADFQDQAVHSAVVTLPINLQMAGLDVLSLSRWFLHVDMVPHLYMVLPVLEHRAKGSVRWSEESLWESRGNGIYFATTE